MPSYNTSVIFALLNICLSQATIRDSYFNLKQSFVETTKEELLGLSNLSCASVCGSVNGCCGFNFDRYLKMCILLKHCTYGTETPRGMSYFKSGVNGDVCSRDNVALYKPCGQSSVYSNSSINTCDKANDGSFTSMIHTVETGWDGSLHYGESYPFWWVDLLSSRAVKEVVINNRQNHNFDRLHNINITVGDDLANLHQCGYYDGTVPNMSPLTIKCTPEVKGRYVQIMIMDASTVDNFLHITEAEVYDCWP